MTCGNASVGVPADGSTRWWSAAGLCGALAVAALVRCHGWFGVFPEPGVVRLGLDDSAYHARRALYTFENFPAALTFDSYIAFPDGAPVPMPPLYDWLVGSVARLFGDTPFDFERVAAFAAVAAGVLVLLPVYELGRALGGAAVGVGAAWLVAVLPASSQLSSVGNVDHHAAVALLALCWLASSVSETLPRPWGRALRVALHGLIVASMLLVWSGSLLYVAVGESARLLVAGVLWRRPQRLLDQAASALLALVLVAPWVAIAPVPIGGPFSSTTLSWLHAVVMGALAVLTASLGALERRRPETRVGARALRALASALLIGLPLLAVPELRGALTAGIGFVGGQDTWAGANPEQQPLFSPMPGLALTPTARFGWLAYLLPVLPVLVALGLRDRARREALSVTLVWVGALTALALQQLRYANDLAPVAAVVAAWGLGQVAQGLRRRLPSPYPALIAVGMAALLLWPALAGVQWPRARGLLRQVRQGPVATGGTLNQRDSLLVFAESVREATPETRGFLDPAKRPEYGLLVPAFLGHVLVYAARRPVPANNFGPYLDVPKYEAVQRFYQTLEESEAFEIASELAADFVLTSAQPPPRPLPFWMHLHLRDGRGVRGRAHAERFRLVTEGPENGVVLGRAFGRRASGGQVPYKLFERVEGALLRIPGETGALVKLELALETPTHRRMLFRARGRVGEDAVALLRVAYSTDPVHPVRARGLYRAEVGGVECELDVPDRAVRTGATLEFPACHPED
jgi:asparagine N-glycosylation enzyme membrane subunit Stt3